MSRRPDRAPGRVRVTRRDDPPGRNRRRESSMVGSRYSRRRARATTVAPGDARSAVWTAAAVSPPGSTPSLWRPWIPEDGDRLLESWTGTTAGQTGRGPCLRSAGRTIRMVLRCNDTHLAVSGRAFEQGVGNGR